ncbi:MAG: hypothetical protein V4582_13405 [Pseudomonadota bacterium]
MKLFTPTLLAAAVLASASCAALAADTKDIVLDRVLAPVVTTMPGNPPPSNSDAMAVSVLLETAGGTLIPKSTDTLFHTGDRFRVKLLSSREGKVSLYNTTPRGDTNPSPVWQGEVHVGMETISPRLALAGTSGVDQLHIVMEPTQETSVFGWLGNWLRSFKDGGASKDIRLDVQNTSSATYLVNANGQGLVSTVRIMHTAR